jgi:hypothetical protein
VVKRLEGKEKSEKYSCINKIIGPFIICGRITKLIFLFHVTSGAADSVFSTQLYRLPVQSVLSLNRI